MTKVQAELDETKIILVSRSRGERILEPGVGVEISASHWAHSLGLGEPSCQR